MTVVDEARGASSGARPGGGEFDRTPPQAIEAEQSVLGAMMLSKDAIADVVEVIRPGDFYRPAHQQVYDAVLDLYARGEPADAVTVSAELTRTGQLSRIGGAPYLHTLISLVPTAANAGYYAAIVADRATLRRLVTAGTRIVQMGYEASSGNGEELAGTIDDVVDRAQVEIYDVTERRTSEDYFHIETLLQPTLDEIEKISATGGVGTGIPTGFQQLDEITNGLHPGQMVTVAGRPGSGKALALDTPLVTPTGWTTMGAVKVGDELIGADGRPTQVVAATDIMRDRPCYDVEFSDGTVITADAEHQWLTATRAQRRSFAVSRELIPASVGTSDSSELLGKAAIFGVGPGAASAVVTTREIAATLHCRTADRRVNHSIACARPLQLPDAELPIPPYTLGAWLGDGTSAAAQLTCADDQILDHVRSEGIEVRPSRARLRYRLSLPQTPAAVGRNCEVCGQEFTPALPQVRTCGQSCGGKVRFRSASPPAPRCPDCGIRVFGWRRCAACHALRGTVQARLRVLGVLQNKHIPMAYLRASEPQRRALLRGLLDTDGYATKSGTAEFAVTSERLARDVFELVVGLGYRAAFRSKRVAGHTEESSTCFTVTFTASERVFGLDRKAARQLGSVRASTQRRFVVDVRPVASVPVRCVQVDNADHLYLAGRTMIPTHNSTLALDFARAAAVKNQKPTAIFSLEMGKLEIMMRLFSAEAGVALANMRSGHMNDQDWRRLALRSSELAEAPLFIDDSPNLTMMEIRAKARRLAQRHDLQLIVIDYLQLMTSGKRVESRQQEVSEFSRATKLLAKELEVPVIVLSQLNRSSEQRTDKKPMLSDLRESGCLPASTRVWRADTGAETSMGELHREGARDITVWAMDRRLRMVPRRMTHVFSTGTKPVFRVRLASGRTIDATVNHPLYTYDGWRPLGEVKTGDRLAIARNAPQPLDVIEWTEHEVLVAADEVTAHGSGAQFVPPGVFGLPTVQVALFLRHLWATEGCVHVNASGAVRVYYASTSRRLADDVTRLLTRFGITARIKTTRKAEYRESYHVHVVGCEAQRVFLDEIGCHGARGDAVRRARTALLGVQANTNLDTVPREVWERVRTVLHDRETTHREFASVMQTKFSGPTMWKHSPSRARLARVAAVLDDADLDMLATNDVYWDSVVDIEPLGEQEVFDATVPGEHNFVADGVMVHNSIEQDSDVVLLVHRPDLYEPETERAGEADLIIAKHRNGPTATVAVAFQGRYSRFADMPS